MSGIRTSIIVPLFVLAAGQSVCLAIGPLLWTNELDGTIISADINGQNQSVLIGGLTGNKTPGHVAVDLSGGKIYWSEPIFPRIRRANLDGTNIETVLTLPLSHNHPAWLALDSVQHQLYFTDFLNKSIRRVNFDGSGLEIVLSGTTNTPHPVDIQLDTAAGKMYWSDSGSVRRANLDGSAVESVISGVSGLPLGLSLDVTAGTMYWKKTTNKDTITRSTLNGAAITPLVDLESQKDLLGMDLDIAHQKIYWADNFARIQRSNFDGTGVETVLQTNFITDITFVPEPATALLLLAAFPLLGCRRITSSCLAANR